MDRKTFLRSSLCCAALAACPGSLMAATTENVPKPDGQNAATVHDWLTSFLGREEKNLDRAALIKLLEERGRLCCRRLDFRQKLIADSNGDVDKLVALMGQIVGPENSTREGDTVTLIYPSGKCGCGWNPKREPVADDPFCECSKANNQALFETVSGRPVHAEVVESPRRGGKQCRFVIRLG